MYAALYWEEPDACDRRLSDPIVSAALEPVAAAVGSATAAQWWATPLDRATQQEVSFELPEQTDALPETRDPVAALADWRAGSLAEERRAEKRRDDPAASYSGSWWSTPALYGLVHSTRTLGTHGPVRLSLVEDAMDWTSAQCRAVQVRPGASIFEIDGPDDWSALVARYPLAVPRSRRHDWFRLTGQDADWAIPDYAAIAADYDGIHLSVMGYLTSAGRVLRAGGYQTVLAGWSPDETWWLSDAGTPTGSPTRWRLDAETVPLGWKPERG